MALLTGKVKSMRVVEGEYKSGKRKGENWEFVALELVDVASGHIWSCQISSDDDKYKEVAQESLVGHRVKVTIMGQTVGEREMGEGEHKHKVLQVRSQITNVRDLGLPRDDEE